ncbi:hypothetical protein BTH42_30880 [Burkholderia sp. SRS-W-2-2016]|nr:hypothetical protein BTH42_30880 [Burkholderia sp. SRS-W-2-2016]
MPAWLGLAWLGSARLGSARLGSARLGLAWLGFARLGFARLGFARLGSTVGARGPVRQGVASFMGMTRALGCEVRGDACWCFVCCAGLWLLLPLSFHRTCRTARLL